MFKLGMGDSVTVYDGDGEAVLTLICREDRGGLYDTYALPDFRAEVREKTMPTIIPSKKPQPAEPKATKLVPVRVTPEAVAAAVTARLGVTIEDMHTNGQVLRCEPLPLARAVFSYVCHEHAGMSYPAIGDWLCNGEGKMHTTAITGAKRLASGGDDGASMRRSGMKGLELARVVLETARAAKREEVV